LAKLLNKILRNIEIKNGPSGSNGGVGGSFNRDPKANRVKRVGYQISNSSGGGGRDNFETPDVDFELIETAIRTDAYLSQSIMKYEELIFKSGWSLQGKNEQSLQYVKLRLDMIAVATQIPTEELFQGIARDIVRYNNCFLVKARAKNGVGLPPGITATPVPPSKEPIAGYFILPPKTIQISRDQNGTVLKYKQEVQGADKPVEFKPEDIIHIKDNVLTGRAFGDPWISSVLDDVRLLRKVEENIALLIYKHIFPLLKYKVGLDKEGFEAADEEIEEIQQMVEDMPTDGIMVMPERHDIESVLINAIDGKPYLDYFENRVFSGLGMSQVDFGRGDTANRSTADAMTGIKADRVKRWQQIIQTQIDKYIIDELLVEGGFDPLVNPEYDVNFVFNEIEIERKIKQETHEIFKFNNNMQTWEETRTALGLDPVADENRLQFQMIGKTEQGIDEVNNKNQPENQHGKRTGPKRPTESLQESISDNTESYHFLESIREVYFKIRDDTIESIRREKNRLIFPSKSPKIIESSISLSVDRLQEISMKYAKKAFNESISKCKEDLKQVNYPDLQESVALRVIENDIKESVSLLVNKIKELIRNKFQEAKNLNEAIAFVLSIFESYESKWESFCKTLLARSYNYGYVLSLLSYGEKKASIKSEKSCKKCKEHDNDLLNIEKFSSFPESIFYKIPPWHYGCKCEVTKFNGGESD